VVPSCFGAARGALSGAALGGLGLIACDVQPLRTVEGTVPVAGLCSQVVASVQSDYQSSSVGAVESDGSVAARSLLSSASASPGLVAALGGDVVLPTSPQPVERMVLLDRYPAGVLTWLDATRGEVLAQLSLGVDFAANPHDYLELGPHRAWVTRFEPHPGHDEGDDLVIVDPSLPAVVGRIPLEGAASELPAGSLVRPDKLLLAGGQVRVLCSAYSGDFLSSASSRLLSLEPDSGGITGVSTLEGYHGCAGLALSPDGEHLAVACSGEFGGDSEPTLEGSGLVVLAVDEELRVEARFDAEAFGRRPAGFGVAFASDESVLLTTFGKRDPSTGATLVPDRLWSLRWRQDRAARLVLTASEPFVLGGVRCEPECGACQVADAGAGALRLLQTSTQGVTLRGQVALDDGTGLPPRELGLLLRGP